MGIEDLTASVSSVVISSLATFIAFIPSLIGGFIVLAIGLILGAIVYRSVVGILKAVQVEKFLEKYGIVKIEGKEIQWTEILAEIMRFTIIIIFLIPALQAWGLDSVNAVLSRVILYIPNVIVAVILAIVGMVLAKLAYGVAYSTSRSLGRDNAHTVGLVAQWSLTVFVGFLVLHQLGVAQELLRILFAGVVVMVALAGGLAFGLGGQHVAKSLLEAALEKFRSQG